MEFKILWGGAMLMGGWLAAYLFARQLMFNYMIAYPLIKKMCAAKSDLIAPGASRYTAVSVAVSALFCAICFAVVLVFCALYLKICFVAGFAVGAVMVAMTLKPTNRAMFDSFCTGYYRFVPDDELRTAMYNKKPSQMKLRLHAMEVDTSFVPKFEDRK